MKSSPFCICVMASTEILYHMILYCSYYNYFYPQGLLPILSNFSGSDLDSIHFLLVGKSVKHTQIVAKYLYLILRRHYSYGTSAPCKMNCSTMLALVMGVLLILCYFILLNLHSLFISCEYCILLVISLKVHSFIHPKCSQKKNFKRFQLESSKKSKENLQLKIKHME